MARLNNRNVRKAEAAARKAEAEAAAKAAELQAQLEREAAEIAELAAEAAANAEVDEQIAKANSVVKRKYKLRYKARAREIGAKGKAPKRSNWDWLAQQLAAATLTKKEHLDVDAFVAILDENGVDHSRWTNRSKGWQGRFRMTGRLALQTKVAETGVLVIGGERHEAPAEWVAHHTN